MDFIEAGLTLKKEYLMIILKNVYGTFATEKFLFTSLLFDFLVLVFICLRPNQLSTIQHGLNLNTLWSNPQNNNVEMWSRQLKFKVTNLEPHLHKITGQFFEHQTSGLHRK